MIWKHPIPHIRPVQDRVAERRAAPEFGPVRSTTLPTRNLGSFYCTNSDLGSLYPPTGRFFTFVALLSATHQFLQHLEPLRIISDAVHRVVHSECVLGLRVGHRNAPRAAGEGGAGWGVARTNRSMESLWTTGHRPDRGP
eukprot:scaffold31988_cov67-Phaeocystis_antarctica.AAC.7